MAWPWTTPSTNLNLFLQFVIDNRWKKGALSLGLLEVVVHPIIHCGPTFMIELFICCVTICYSKIKLNISTKKITINRQYGKINDGSNCAPCCRIDISWNQCVQRMSLQHDNCSRSCVSGHVTSESSIGVFLFYKKKISNNILHKKRFFAESQKPELTQFWAFSRRKVDTPNIDFVVVRERVSAIPTVRDTRMPSYH